MRLSITATQTTSRRSPLLALNAFHLGVEWARIEPERRQLSTAALDHNSRIVECYLGHGATPIVTLHQFARPQGLVRDGSCDRPIRRFLLAAPAPTRVASGRSG